MVIVTDKNDSAIIREFAIFQLYVFLKLIWFLYKNEPFVLQCTSISNNKLNFTCQLLTRCIHFIRKVRRKKLINDTSYEILDNST